MRYYSYNEYDPDSPRSDASGSYVATVSEDDIRQTYWPYWYKNMCEKFGQEFIDANYSFEDCLTNWITVNWAWPVLDNEEYDREKSHS
jgi:hypothetical protein